ATPAMPGNPKAYNQVITHRRGYDDNNGMMRGNVGSVHAMRPDMVRPEVGRPNVVRPNIVRPNIGRPHFPH
ncbi:hypothetical protein, partial [Acidithiobacillus thiooxidans]|uniref:hypothetical protein n=1 Tax=Acidithiobacillus thiooxidans TaxID=930 RepID=UPI00242B5AA1